MGFIAFQYSFQPMPLSCHLAQLQKKLGYTFKKPALLQEGLSHPSRAFQRLEFLGDRILNLSIGHWLYHHDELAPEGELSKKLSGLVSRPALRNRALFLGLEPLLNLPLVPLQSRILSDTVEALLGAIYLDGGFLAAQKVVEHLWKELLGGPLAFDAKTQLQEHLQAQGHSLPEYEMIDQNGPSHQPTFSIKLTCAIKDVFYAKGASKKQAEQKAAQKALEFYQKKKEVEP